MIAISARFSSTSTRHSDDDSVSSDVVSRLSPDEVEPVVSSVNATLTSEVVIKSTEILCRARMLNTSARKPRECNMRCVCTVASVCLRRNDSERNSGGLSAVLQTKVPPEDGFLQDTTN